MAFRKTVLSEGDRKMVKNLSESRQNRQTKKMTLPNVDNRRELGKGMTKDSSGEPLIETISLQEFTKTQEHAWMTHRPGPPKPRTFLRNRTPNVPGAPVCTNDTESFHCAISGILWFAQLFGILPLSGIRASSPQQLSFVKLSLRTIYAAFITVIVFVTSVISLIHMVRTLNTDAFATHGGIGAATAGAVFYGNSLLGTLVFLWLSPRWVSLQQDWRAMEHFIDSNKNVKPKLRWKFWLISCVILSLAVVEHVLSVANNTHEYYYNTTSYNSSFSDFLRIYSHASHAFILDVVNYNLTLGIFIFTVSKIATFTWNFTDLFVMLVSTGLAERYKCLNKWVLTTMHRHRSTIDWCELREDYAMLSTMVKRVDNDISPIILLSFGNNLYFICLQLLNGLSRPKDSTTMSAIYFFGSFAFLIGRTSAVTLLTARINDQSKLALPMLYNCSSSSFNIETQRLQYQLTTDDIALTGLRFFSITRNFMLAVAGAIVTYEVVLLQFNVAMHK